MFKFDSNSIEELSISNKIKSVFDKLIQKVHTLAEKTSLPKDLLQLEQAKELLSETAKTFENAISESIKKLGVGFKPDKVFIEKLTKQAWIFSGFKTEKQLLEISGMLAGADGKILPFNKFRDKVLSINKTYNGSYLKAEYDTAISTALSASQWNQYEKDAKDEVEFYLQYRTAGDERVRDQHSKLNNITLPMEDEFWDSHIPPNGWRCRCRVIQVLKDFYEPTKPEQVTKATEGVFTPKEEIFAYNPGKTAQPFPPNHPYYKVQKERKAEIEKTATELYAKEIEEKINNFKKAIDAYKGTVLLSDSIKTGEIVLMRKSVKEVLHHNLDIDVRAYLLNINDDIDNWKYLGWTNVQKGKHKDTAYFFYYSTIINNTERFINVKIHKHLNSEYLYVILNGIDKSKLKTGLPTDIEKYITKK